MLGESTHEIESPSGTLIAFNQNAINVIPRIQEEKGKYRCCYTRRHKK